MRRRDPLDHWNRECGPFFFLCVNKLKMICRPGKKNDLRRWSEETVFHAFGKTSLLLLIDDGIDIDVLNGGR